MGWEHHQWTAVNNGAKSSKQTENAVSTPQMKRMPLLVSVATLQAFLLWPYYSGNNGYPATRSWTNLCWKCPSTCLVLSLQPRQSPGFWWPPARESFISPCSQCFLGFLDFNIFNPSNHPSHRGGGLSSLTWITFSARDGFFCPRLMVSTNQPTTH